VCAPGDDNRYVRVGWFARSKLSAYWCRDHERAGDNAGTAGLRRLQNRALTSARWTADDARGGRGGGVQATTSDRLIASEVRAVRVSPRATIGVISQNVENCTARIGADSRPLARVLGGSPGSGRCQSLATPLAPCPVTPAPVQVSSKFGVSFGGTESLLVAPPRRGIPRRIYTGMRHEGT